MSKYIIRDTNKKRALVKKVKNIQFKTNLPKTKILQSLNIPKSTFYDWIKSNCTNKSKKPHNSPNKIPKIIENKILKRRDNDSKYRSQRSPNGISTYLEQYNVFLTNTAIWKVLKRHGKNRELIGRRKKTYSIFPKGQHFLDVVCIDDIQLSNRKPRDLAIFNAIDEYSQMSLVIKLIHHKVNQFDVLDILREIYRQYGKYPKTLRLDNAQAHHAKKVKEWCKKRGITVQYIDPGKPQQNWPVEVFNNVLQQDIFYSNSVWNWQKIHQMQEKLDDYKKYYNEEKRLYSDKIKRTPYEIASGITNKNTQKRLKHKLSNKYNGQLYTFKKMLKNAYFTTNSLSEMSVN